MQIIKYNPSLTIANVSNLPHGLNCKYLEVIEAHIPGVFIAKQWRRKPAETAEILIEFNS